MPTSPKKCGPDQHMTHDLFLQQSLAFCKGEDNVVAPFKGPGVPNGVLCPLQQGTRSLEAGIPGAEKCEVPYAPLFLMAGSLESGHIL